uniref:Uncharacterized protein n=1 Tax=Timema cristinae TaxID=61476 RepID=A0A7R9CCS5_TIMCR|nr:unnamed protein product [Timema cristinae]
MTSFNCCIKRLVTTCHSLSRDSPLFLVQLPIKQQWVQLVDLDKCLLGGREGIVSSESCFVDCLKVFYAVYCLVAECFWKKGSETMLTTSSNGQFGPEAPKEVAPATVFPSDVTLHRVQAGSTPFSVTSSMLLLQTQLPRVESRRGTNSDRAPPQVVIMGMPTSAERLADSGVKSRALNNQSDFVRLCGFTTNSNLVTAVKGGRDAFSLVLKARHVRVRTR